MKLPCSDYEIALLGCALIVLICLASCRDTSNPITNDIVFPDSNVSYYRQVQPLFYNACATAACHDRATDENKHLDLTYYQGLKNGDFPIVYARDTTTSILVWCIEWRDIPNVYPMPRTKQLSQNQIKGIKRWIMEGAGDDTP